VKTGVRAYEDRVHRCEHGCAITETCTFADVNTGACLRRPCLSSSHDMDHLKVKRHAR
jgi:hypothetical protein